MNNWIERIKGFRKNHLFNYGLPFMTVVLVGPFILKQFNNVRWVFWCLYFMHCAIYYIWFRSKNITLTNRTNWMLDFFSMKTEWFLEKFIEIFFKKLQFESIVQYNGSIQPNQSICSPDTWYSQPKQWCTYFQILFSHMITTSFIISFEYFRLAHLIFLKRIKKANVWILDMFDDNES